MAVKKKTTRRRKPKKATVQGHVNQVWSYFLWAKNNPWVFAVIATFWASVATGAVHITARVLDEPVREIIVKYWSEYVAPYDSAVISIEERLLYIEQKLEEK